MDLEKAWHHGEVQFSRRPKDLRYLAELVERYEAKLVIVDPVRNHLQGVAIARAIRARGLRAVSGLRAGR